MSRSDVPVLTIGKFYGLRIFTFHQLLNPICAGGGGQKCPTRDTSLYNFRTVSRIHLKLSVPEYLSILNRKMKKILKIDFRGSATGGQISGGKFE